MKRRILIAALALVLAVGGIAALNIHTASKATSVEMQVISSTGDASAAEGLLVDHRIMLGGNLLWYTDYVPATGESDTNFLCDVPQHTAAALLSLAGGEDRQNAADVQCGGRL